MCTGGRIRHHLKHNVWRENCHVVIVGFQASGTLGRTLVNSAQFISLWGEKIRVAAQVHTLGGLSAHADQQELVRWYGHFANRPALILVHGETDSIAGLQAKIQEKLGCKAHVPRLGEKMNLLRYPKLVNH